MDRIRKIETNASKEELDTVMDLVREQLESADCPMKAQMQTELAVEEVFVNIANYAYQSGSGKVVVTTGFQSDPLTFVIVFEDNGIPYDPLKNDDPDITLSAEERPIGGMGIFLVKKNMDDVFYEYRDGKNILTLKKSL
ncbi:MAG: ATP-binding protein [Oscillospiraceae bacterium]|nr:ATP-binding protein [Oscillospiraceae bacterium]